MLYEVKAIKNRRIKTVKGYRTADEGYVSYLAYQNAESPQRALEIARDYYIPSGTRYDRIEVSAA